jgi:hypothetical protein
MGYEPEWVVKVWDKPKHAMAELTGNPVDVIKWLANEAGRKLDFNWVAYWRAYCEQPAGLEQDK